MMTPDVAKRWIADIRSNGAHPFHAGDPTATREVEGLYARAYPEERAFPEERAIPEEHGPALSGALTGAPQNYSGDPMSLYDPARSGLLRHRSEIERLQIEAKRAKEAAHRREEAEARRLRKTEKAEARRIRKEEEAEREATLDRRWEEIKKMAEAHASKEGLEPPRYAVRDWRNTVTKSGFEMDRKTGKAGWVEMEWKSPVGFMSGDGTDAMVEDQKRQGKIDEKNLWLIGVLENFRKANEDMVENDRQRRAIQEKVGGYRNWEPR